MQILGMRATLALLNLACICAFSSDLENANHIFNSIQSAMKMWGSSVNHNGMTFYLASVPKGTRLFHGDALPTPRTDVVFLAFEPEHALHFARPKRTRGPGGPGGPGGPDDRDNVPYRSRSPLERCSSLLSRFWRWLLGLKPTAADEIETPFNSSSTYGWLHTYVTTRDLRLVYVDGMSAGKSNKGTLDSQDRILFNDSIDEGGMRDYDRLYSFCDVAESDFQGTVDGMLRMELGFEINLCDPLAKLDLVAIDATAEAEPGKQGKRGKRGRRGPGSGSAGDDMRIFSSRYHGIGGDRAHINFDHFLTAYNYSLDLFPNGASLPRLSHIQMEDLEPIQRDVKAWVLAHSSEPGTVDWQAIADMVVARYGQSLKELSQSKSMDFILKEAYRLLKPFADLSDPRQDQLLHRCASQFIPEISSALLPADAVYTVSYRICSDLAALGPTITYEGAKEKVDGLIDYLQWPSWRECEACRSDEFCQIPIWPHGSQSDYDNPSCQKFTKAFENGNDYWGMPGM